MKILITAGRDSSVNLADPSEPYSITFLSSTIMRPAKRHLKASRAFRYRGLDRR